jgi:hypothetical protein
MLGAKFRSTCNGWYKRLEILFFHVNIPFMDFIINTQGYYQTVLSVHSVNTRNTLRVRRPMLASQPPSTPLHNHLHQAYAIRAEARYTTCVQNISSFNPRYILGRPFARSKKETPFSLSTVLQYYVMGWSQWLRGLRSWVRITLDVSQCVCSVFMLSYVQIMALRQADPPSKSLPTV